MTVDSWYMSPAAVVIATIAMVSCFHCSLICPRTGCPMIRAMIFDLDGTLVHYANNSLYP
jgi:hypothetical protein